MIKQLHFIWMFIIFGIINSFAQQDFRVRQVDTVRGDIIMVGNTILGLTDNPPNSPYDVLGTSNGGVGMNTAYIDIDGDNSTFSSSSADIINPTSDCTEVVYAGLYWSANYYMAREDPIANSLTFGIRTNNGSFTGFYTAVRSAFDNDTSSDNPVTANLVLADEISACGELSNQAQIAGNIAVISLGTCNFRSKVVNVQNAGAIGVILVNTNGETGTVTGNGGTTITIPTVSIGNNDIAGDDLITLIQNSAAPISATVGQEQTSNVVMTVNNTTIAGVYAAGASGFTSDNSDIRLSPASSNLVTNTADFPGNIAVIREGANNRDAIVNAQTAGAIGVVIVGSTTATPTMTGGGATINIPSIAIGNAAVNGQDLITFLGTESNVVNATLSTTGNEQLTGLPATDPRINGTADYRDIMLGFGAPGAVNYVPVQSQTGVQVVDGVTTHSGVIYDGYAGTISNPSILGADNMPYTAYADVTSIVQANGFGTYTVGNMKATVGENSGVSGSAGGWTLVVIYEDPIPSTDNAVRFISISDGFREIQGNQNGIGSTLDLTVSGFTAPPAPAPVDVRFGVASLEGDNGINGDQLLIQNAVGVDVPLADVNNINPADNFFNSSISIDGAYNLDRNPASLNTLGYDTDIFDLNNGNNLIPNGATSANFTLATVRDVYQPFLTVFSIENIVPKIRNINQVFDPTDLETEISGTSLALGQELMYRLNLKNVGNENIAGDAVIEDVLPANVNLISIDGIDVSAQPNGNLNSIPSITYTTSGVELGTGQTITFIIPSDLLELTDEEFSIDVMVQLVPSCEDLKDLCSNIIANEVFTSYTGALSGISIVNEPMANSVLDCGSIGEVPLNFIGTVPPCTTDIPFCSGELVLTAAADYDLYEWTGPNGFSENTVVSFINIPNPVNGIYSVTKIDTTPDEEGNVCMTLQEEFIVHGIDSVEIELEVSPITASENGVIVVNAIGETSPFTYELLNAENSTVIITSQTSNALVVETAGDYIVKVTDTNGCFYIEPVSVENLEEHPIIEFADEILFCTILGQSYPVINIESEEGELLEVSFTNTLSIVWQQLDTINCNVSFDEMCPTTDDSCSSDWFDIDTGNSTVITEPGEYRVIITFNAKSSMGTRTFYFRAKTNLLSTDDIVASKINLTPNPASSVVTVNTEIKAIRVFDVSGKMVLETNQNTFDISTLENGMYFTEIETITGRREFKRIMKK